MCLIQKETIKHCLLNKGEVIVDLGEGKLVTQSGQRSRSVCSTKYQQFDLNGKTVLVHVFFAILKWGYKCEGYQVNHINCDPSDNRINNLELVTPKQNTQYAFSNGRIANKYGRRGRKVFQVDEQGVVIAEFLSTADAARKTGCIQELVSRVCRGERKTTNGKMFIFA